jgi:glycine cleavage system H protein
LENYFIEENTVSIPEDLKYTESHEWVRIIGTDTCEIGLTDYAQHELGDIVFVNLPQPGSKLVTGSSFADVESVKAVSDIYSPLDGEVLDVNEQILDSPENVNSEPYAAWLIKAKGTFKDGVLLSADAYQSLIKK